MKTLPSVLFAMSVLLAPAWLSGAYRETVGWNALVEELGDDVPLGRNIPVSLIESPPFGGNYQPDTGNMDLAGKTFSMKSGDAGISEHATSVAQLFFGNTSSMAREIDTIDVYESVDWLRDGFLGTEGAEAPVAETNRIQSHSWVGNFVDAQDVDIEAIRRFDYAIDRDGFVAVVALSNDTGEVRSLLAHSYNAIAVGRPDGAHSRGGTRFDEPGRTKPDLVAPGGFLTSFSVPVVSSAAAVLLEEADRNAGLAGAREHPQLIKSILMAGATKTPFAEWSRSDGQPLDEVFGAGRLDIHNSYRILTGGEYEPGNGGYVPGTGWYLGDTASGDGSLHFFSLDRGSETFTANLAWHRLFDPDDGFDLGEAEPFVARLELRLFEADGFDTGEEIQISTDPANNVQHVYVEGLPPGEYVLLVDVVDDPSPDGVPYALAWDAVPAPPRTFAEWRAKHFPGQGPEMSGPGVDPDGDGIPNLMEYALGGDPLAADREVLPVPGVAVENGSRYLTLAVTRSDGLEDLVYRVDASDDLMDWSEDAGVLIESVVHGDGTITDIYRDTEPIGEAAGRFLRLSVELEE